MDQTIHKKPDDVMVNELKSLMETVYMYATVPLYTESFNIEIPKFIAKGMWLSEITVKSGQPRDGYCYVDIVKFQDAIFRQGHVSQMITMFAYLEKMRHKEASFWKEKRRRLTEVLIEFAKREISCLKDWDLEKQVDGILHGNITLNSLAMVMRPWLYIPQSDAERKMLQYILPLFLFLGDYTITPDAKSMLKQLRYVIVGSISYLGANTWRGTFYDDSHATRLFPEIVKVVNKLFAMDRKSVRVKGLLVRLFIKPKNENKALPRLLQQAGNWLSFGAYITLVSKYARYSLPNESGIMQVADIFKQEKTKYYTDLTNKLEKY